MLAFSAQQNGEWCNVLAQTRMECTREVHQNMWTKQSSFSQLILLLSWVKNTFAWGSKQSLKWTNLTPPLQWRQFCLKPEWTKDWSKGTDLGSKLTIDPRILKVRDKIYFKCQAGTFNLKNLTREKCRKLGVGKSFLSGLRKAPPPLFFFFWCTCSVYGLGLRFQSVCGDRICSAKGKPQR